MFYTHLIKKKKNIYKFSRNEFHVFFYRILEILESINDNYISFYICTYNVTM